MPMILGHIFYDIPFKESLSFLMDLVLGKCFVGGSTPRKQIPKTFKGGFSTETLIQEPRRTSRIIFRGGLPPSVEFRGHIGSRKE